MEKSVLLYNFKNGPHEWRNGPDRAATVEGMNYRDDAPEHTWSQRDMFDLFGRVKKISDHNRRSHFVL